MNSVILSLITFVIASLVFVIEASSYSHLSETELSAKLKELLSTRSYKEASEVADAAIEKNPNNYVFYHQRSIANLAQGRTGTVISDLNKIIQIKPDFETAYSTRANLYLKQGLFEQAESDYKKLLELNPSNMEAKNKLDDTMNAAAMVKRADTLINSQNWRGAIDELTKVFEISPSSSILRLKRGQCYENIGDLEMALAEYKRTTQLKADSPSVYLKSAKILYLKGDVDASIEELKACLHIDPEEKACFNFRKVVKEAKTILSKAEELANKKQWNELVNHCTTAITKFPHDAHFLHQKMNHFLCKGSSSMKNIEKAIAFCTKAIELDSHDGQSYANRAEAFILQEKFQEAINDYTKALEIEPQNHSFAQGKQKAEGLLKQSQTVDYYKILGVKRTASQEDIKREYRNLAREWHPDKYKGEDQEKAQKKMAQINQAYEILSDEELRKKYDAGEDPNNPQGQGGPGGPGGFHNFFFQGGGFPGGGFPGGGGGGGFRFNFG